MHGEGRRLVERSAWLQTLPDGVRTAVLANLHSRVVEPGQALFRRGDPFCGLYCVVTGQFHVRAQSHDGLEIVMGILRPGDWTGFLAAFDAGTHALDVTADVASRVAFLSPADTSRIFEADVAAFKCLVRPELDVSRQIYTYFVEHFGRAPIYRIAERLLGLGRWPYTDGSDDPAPLEVVTQEDIAASTRISRQTVNRCLRELEAAGLVEIGYGRVRLIDHEGLARVASGKDYRAETVANATIPSDMTAV